MRDAHSGISEEVWSLHERCVAIGRYAPNSTSAPKEILKASEDEQSPVRKLINSFIPLRWASMNKKSEICASG